MAFSFVKNVIAWLCEQKNKNHPARPFVLVHVGGAATFFPVNIKLSPTRGARHVAGTRKGSWQNHI